MPWWPFSSKTKVSGSGASLKAYAGVDVRNNPVRFNSPIPSKTNVQPVKENAAVSPTVTPPKSGLHTQQKKNKTQTMTFGAISRPMERPQTVCEFFDEALYNSVTDRCETFLTDRFIQQNPQLCTSMATSIALNETASPKGTAASTKGQGAAVSTKGILSQGGSTSTVQTASPKGTAASTKGILSKGTATCTVENASPKGTAAAPKVPSKIIDSRSASKLPSSSSESDSSTESEEEEDSSTSTSSSSCSSTCSSSCCSSSDSSDCGKHYSNGGMNLSFGSILPQLGALIKGNICPQSQPLGLGALDKIIKSRKGISYGEEEQPEILLTLKLRNGCDEEENSSNGNPTIDMDTFQNLLGVNSSSKPNAACQCQSQRMCRCGSGCGCAYRQYDMCTSCYNSNYGCQCRGLKNSEGNGTTCATGLNNGKTNQNLNRDGDAKLRSKNPPNQFGKGNSRAPAGIKERNFNIYINDQSGQH